MAAGDRFVNVPAEALESALAAKGFERGVHGREVVYRFRHKRDPRYVVCVFTSIRNGAQEARGLGEDAIRVCAYQETGEGRTRGIAKSARVFRTGSIDKVLGRIFERAREAYDVCSKRIPRVEVSTRAPNAPASTRVDAEHKRHVLRENRASTALGQHFDHVQQKHHPGSWPVGAERGFLDGVDDREDP